MKMKMKKLTRDEIVVMIKNKIKNENEYEQTYACNHLFAEALRHAKKRLAYEELLRDIIRAEERK